MHPRVCLRIPSPAGRNDMQMRVVLAITPMGLDHDDIAALEGLATHRTKEIVQALHPTLHEWTEQRFGMLIKWCSQDIRHGEDNMPIDDPVMEHLTNLSDPMVDIDLGTSQAQRRLTAHGNAMFPLTTMETAVFDRAYLVRIPTPEHLVDKVIVVTNGVSRLQTNEPNSTCRPSCHGHTLPPHWSKACHPARSGGVYDHHHRVYHRLILRGRRTDVRSAQKSRGPPLAQ